MSEDFTRGPSLQEYYWDLYDKEKSNITSYLEATGVQFKEEREVEQIFSTFISIRVKKFPKFFKKSGDRMIYLKEEPIYLVNKLVGIDIYHYEANLLSDDSPTLQYFLLQYEGEISDKLMKKLEKEAKKEFEGKNEC